MYTYYIFYNEYGFNHTLTAQPWANCTKIFKILST